MNEQQEERFYDVGEVCSMLGVGRQFVLDRIKSGELPAIRIRGAGGYRISSVNLKLFFLSLQNKQNVR